MKLFRKISAREARDLAAECFPRGPENIAEVMGVDIEYCVLAGTDGWCLHRKGHVPKIRISSRSVKVRRRFTLAHELSHLILGTEPEIVSQSILPFQSVKQEERSADKFAAELLLPLEHLKNLVSGVPVDALTIKRMARRADVSDMVAAGRVVAEAESLGLENGAIAVFKDGDVQWAWSPTLRNVRAAAESLYTKAEAALPNVFRSTPDSQGNVATATVVGSPGYRVLVLQLLPKKEAERHTHHEIARELDATLFEGNLSFRQQFNGCLSGFKRKAEELGLDDAVDTFTEHYGPHWSDDRREMLISDAGQAYLRHRLKAWAVS